MSSPAAVAESALEQAQTAALIGDNHYMLMVLLSALNYIASGGRMYGKRWDGLRKQRSDQ